MQTSSEDNRPRVIICGECNDAKFVYRKLDKLFAKLDKKDPIVCLQGRVGGLDKIVNQWAFGAGYLRKIFYPSKKGQESKAVSEMMLYAGDRLPAFAIVFGADKLVEDWLGSAGVFNVRKIEVP